MKKDKNLKQINDTYEQDRVKIFVDSDNDDLDKIAFKKVHFINKYIVFYIIIFIAIFICSIWQIYNYVEKKKAYDGLNKVIEISSHDSKIAIFNENNGIWIIFKWLNTIILNKIPLIIILHIL